VVVRDTLLRAASRLSEAGVDTPRLDAELLLASVLDVSRAGLVLAGPEPVADTAQRSFEELVARRAEREPVAYILGSKPFRQLELSVDRRVLIPRPETELLVEVGVSLLAPGARVADVGTGSGAVALALADERPDLTVTGIDISDDALAVACANAARLGLERVRFAQADLLDGEPYDAVLANLPYVCEGDELAPEISRFEPAGALFAGPDGLASIRRLVALVACRGEVSLLALEVGAGQAPVVASLLAEARFGAVECRRDLAGIERVVIGRRPAVGLR
jgi:release factor glutamine methyltransferase